MQHFSVTLLTVLALAVPAVLARQSSASASQADIAALLSNSSLASNATDVGSNNGNLNLGIGNLALDSNNLQGSLESNIVQILLGLGVCNFDSNSLSQFSLNDDFQLMLQLQQLQQLLSLGLVSGSSVQQLLEQELFSNVIDSNALGGQNPNNLLFGGIKRKVDDISRRTAGRKRSLTFRKRQCSASQASSQQAAAAPPPTPAATEVVPAAAATDATAATPAESQATTPDASGDIGGESLSDFSR